MRLDVLIKMLQIVDLSGSLASLVVGSTSSPPFTPKLVWETPSSLNIFCKFQISTNQNLPQQLKQPVFLRLKDGSNSISYHAFFNGTDYDPTPGGLEDDLGFPAELHVASVLTFYGLEGSEAVKLHMTAPEVVYP